MIKSKNKRLRRGVQDLLGSTLSLPSLPRLIYSTELFNFFPFASDPAKLASLALFVPALVGGFASAFPALPVGADLRGPEGLVAAEVEAAGREARGFEAGEALGRTDGPATAEAEARGAEGAALREPAPVEGLRAVAAGWLKKGEVLSKRAAVER